jgi:general secretion pathway protein D
MAQELDRRAAHGSEIRVVFLEHADAEQLLPVLQQVIGEAPSSTGSGSGAGSRLSSLNNSSSASNGSSSNGTTGMARTSPSAAPTPVTTNAPASGGGGTATGGRTAVVTRFEGANAIVISAAPDIQRTLGEVIRQLDVRRPQVLVEAIIVEISDTAAQQLGVQLFLSGLRGSNIPFGITNYSNTAPNIGTIAGAFAARELGGTTTTVTTGTGSTTTTTTGTGSELLNAAAGQLAGINGGLAGVAFRSGSAIFGAILNAVRSDNQSNILSTPSIMTLDNVEGHILVGQEIPITTGQALSPNFDNTFRTVQRQNVGITLQVRPQINAGGTIKLDLRVEVSSIAGPVSAGSQDLILNKREIENTITIDEGDIVGVGGLLDDNDRRTLDRVPLLGDIPVLGNLFRSRGRARARTNLMVFIRPTILRNAEDAQEMSARRYNYIRGHQLIVNPNREPTLDELVRDYLGTTPPAAAPGPQPQDQVVTPVPLPPSAAAPQ